MAELQSFPRKMKKLDAGSKKVRYRKSRRLLIMSIVTMVSVYFFTLVFVDNTVKPVQADAIGRPSEAMSKIMLQNMEIARNTEVERIVEEAKVNAACDFLETIGLRWIAGVAEEFEKNKAKDDFLAIFGEQDQLFEDNIFAKEDGLAAGDGIAAGDGMPAIDDAPAMDGMSAISEMSAISGQEETKDPGQEGTGDTKEASKPMDEEAFYALVDLADIPPQLSLRYNPQYCMDLSAEQRKVLETIVEAEAGDEDAYGKILVANVVLNRVLADEFPDTVKEVVFQNNGKIYQFSPVRSGGRYYTVTVSKTTKEAVARALNGEDYSEGALYFFARRYTSNAKAHWFDTALKKIVEYGCHEFFGNK